jgi:hypothetical protein
VNIQGRFHQLVPPRLKLVWWLAFLSKSLQCSQRSISYWNNLSVPNRSLSRLKYILKRVPVNGWANERVNRIEMNVCAAARPFLCQKEAISREVRK